MADAYMYPIHLICIHVLHCSLGAICTVKHLIYVLLELTTPRTVERLSCGYIFLFTTVLQFDILAKFR